MCGDGTSVYHAVLGCRLHVCMCATRWRAYETPQYPAHGSSPWSCALSVSDQRSSTIFDMDNDNHADNASTSTHMISKTPRSLSARALPCSAPRWLDKNDLRKAAAMSIPAVTPELVQNLSDTTHLRDVSHCLARPSRA